MSPQPLRLAIIGMGGFAGHHQRAVQSLEAQDEVQLVATCDPQPERFTAAQAEWKYDERSVQIYRDYREMLDAHQHELDFATVPTPIPLHAPMHRACIERGLGCYLEKPPTLIPDELEAMIAVEVGAKYVAQVGFNFIVEDARRALKRRLLAGDFGRLKRVAFLGFWPRATSYYTRSPWAGKLILDDRLVMDSCTGNALAHHVHDALYWCGQDGELSWGKVHEVETELYRAHAIESFDTAFIRAQCDGEVPVHIAATHAGSGRAWHREWFECENATVVYDTGSRQYTINWADGREETGRTGDSNLMVENLRHYSAYIRGEEPKPLTTLIDSRPFVHLNALNFIAAKTIHTVDSAQVERFEGRDSTEAWLAIKGIEGALEAFGKNGVMPREGVAAWGRAGGRAQASQLPELEAVVRKMYQQSAAAL